MNKKTKEKSLFQPIILLVLQSIALFIIFTILSTTQYFTDFDTAVLSFSLAFIVISSLFTFKILDTLKKQEIEKKQVIY